MRDSKDVLTDLVALLQPHTSYPVGTDNVLSTVQALLDQNTLLRNTSGGVQSGKPESTDAKPDKEDVLRPSYMVNDRVEVWRKNIQQWWPGHISHAHSNGTYDLTYTNGVIETQIKADQIRRKVDVATAVRSILETLFEGGAKLAEGKVEKDSSRDFFTPKPTAEDVEKNEETKEGKFHVGDAVEVNFRGKGVWHLGQIDHVNKDGPYTVHFCQGDFVRNIVPEQVRKASTKLSVKKEEDSKSRTAKPSASTSTQPTGHSSNTAKTANKQNEPCILKVGDRIEVNCQHKGVWYPGVVNSVSYFIGSCDISFDHGEREYYVPLEMVRKPATQGKEGEHTNTSTASKDSYFKVGDRIEVYCRNKGVWYPGVVKSVSYFIGTCDISFDHGEREYYVPLEMVRKPATQGKEGEHTDPSAASTDRHFKVGDRIEVNCRNKSVWYPGVVKSVSYFIGTCDISFDHGEREYYVPTEMVRKPATPGKEGSNASTDNSQTTPSASATTSTTTNTNPTNSAPDKSNLADACTLFILKLAGLMFVLLLVFLAPFFLFLVLSAKLGLKL
eukprot:gene7932-9455_t